MKNSKKITILVGTILFLGVVYWLISPLFRNEKVNESLEDIYSAETSQDTIVNKDKKREDIASKDSQNSNNTSNEKTFSKTGNFEGEAGHNASGEVSLIKTEDKYFVRFEDGFEVTNGPDLFVYFGNNGEYSSEANLGELKGNIGGQNYEVSEDIDPENYNEVWIWCRAFSVPFAMAEFN
jgi:hypothetical protein